MGIPEIEVDMKLLRNESSSYENAKKAILSIISDGGSKGFTKPFSPGNHHRDERS